MKKNKKGLMLKFIITIIIALAVFIPACGFVSKLFRTSDQAEQSFESFVDELIEFAENGEEDEEEVFLLILDVNSAIMKFDAGENLIFGPRISYPVECNNQDCLVLCNKIEGEFCVDLVVRLWEEDVEIGSFYAGRFAGDPRRSTVRMQKIGERIFIYFEGAYAIAPGQRPSSLEQLREQQEQYSGREYTSEIPSISEIPGTQEGTEIPSWEEICIGGNCGACSVAECPYTVGCQLSDNTCINVE